MEGQDPECGYRLGVHIRSPGLPRVCREKLGTKEFPSSLMAGDSVVSVRLVSGRTNAG
jgi:hypothetical protein